MTLVLAGGLDVRLELQTAGSSLATVCTPLTLAPLDENDIDSLLALGVPDEQRADLREYLIEEVGGHAYLAQALLEALPNGGAADVRVALEGTVEAMVERVVEQVATLDPTLQRALHDLAAATPDAGAVQVAPERLVSSGLVCARGDVLAVNGDIARQAILRTQTTPTLRRIDEAILEALVN